MRIRDGKLQISATDMSDFLACRHLARRSIRVALGELEKPKYHDAGFDALVERGRQHEAQVLRRLREELSDDILKLNPFDDGFDAAQASTMAAIARGTDIIYQGVLAVGEEVGLPDFLIRAELLGSDQPGYEIVDAKLARTAKARAVLQTTFYSRLLTHVQDHEPRMTYLALGGGEAFDPYPVKDYAAYERQVARMLGEFAAGDEDPYPDPLEHCAICRWRVTCSKRRRDDDYLSLIAGITAKQRKVLLAAGIRTLEAFGDLEAPPDLEGVGSEAMANVHAQAKTQLKGRRSGDPEWEFRGLARDKEGVLLSNVGLLGLPEPAEGDLFFDIEGARYYSEDNKTFGLQYLFGIVDTSAIDDRGDDAYRGIWSFDRHEEKAGFEELIDFFTEHFATHPGAHIYHYNHYEPTSIDALSVLHDTMQEAVGVLMGRFGTREDALDDLFRMGAFVDLYRIVRQSIRASVESYSIKRLEDLIGYKRKVRLDDVNERMVVFEAGLEDASARTDGGSREIIRGYNEDDCRATLVLRNWLEERRTDLEAQLRQPVPRPAAPEPAEDHDDPEIAALHQQLKAGTPDDPDLRSETQKARALMADLLEWHRREDKPKWWHYFWLRGLDDDELLNDPDALVGLKYIEVVESRRRLHDVRFSFPQQEHGLKLGRTAFDARSTDLFPRGNKVLEINDEGCEVVVTLRIDEPLPAALLPNPTVATPGHRRRLRELGEHIAELGDGVWPRSAANDLLLRRPPNAGQSVNAPVATSGADAADEGARLALALEDSYLPVQGPPGTGKTYAGARMILDLVQAGRKVGVTGPSHAVVDNLLGEVVKVADLLGQTRPRLGQRIDEDHQHVYASAALRGTAYENTQEALADLAEGAIGVLGGTTWVWTSNDADGSVDTLIVDEAGQLSLANTLAIAAACRNLILLGDPMQLAQPSQAAHPGGAGASSLEHVLADERVMPPPLGLFIDKTRRMHPDLCGFTSEIFYDDKLEPISGLERQRINGTGQLAGSGLRLAAVAHSGNASSSPEEAAEVARIISELLGRSWTDEHGAESEIDRNSVLVVTPFNDQIEEIRVSLDDAGLPDVLVGTVDKFQGREAPVTIYSLASSSAEDAPRGMEFLYQLNRLNVATSRARCISVIVASQELTRVLCRTPRQMRLANALCRAEERAHAVVPSAR